MPFLSCHPHLRPLTLVLLLVVCGIFGAGEGFELKMKPEDSSFTRAMGSSFVFTCEISGADRDSTTNYDLKWFHNSSEITSRTASRMYVEDEGTVFRKLYITGFEKQYEGVYKCTGMIEGTLWEKSTNVFLFKDITFDHAPEVQNPTIYTDAVIECRVSGRPTPEVSWRYKGDRIQTGGRYKTVDEGLRITNVTLKDAGLYLCRADVAADGRYGEQKITVAVHNRPRFVADHPKLVHIWAGRTRNMSCKVEGEPVPAIDWLRGNELISNNSTYTIFNSERTSNLQVTVMEVDQIWIYGSYTCKANNELGTNDIKIELRRATAPDSPQSVNVTECLPNSIVLQMEPPVEDGGEKVRGYHVEYSKKMQNISVTIGGEVGEQVPEYNEIPWNILGVLDSDTITIENLKPNTTYMIQVKAKNDVGVSSPKELTVMTHSVQKPSPIQITSKSKAEAGRSYTIAWKKPITGGLPIEQYEFKFRTVSVAEDGSGDKKFGEWQSHIRLDDVNKPMLTYQLYRLTPSTTYDLQVRARNDLGWSDAVAGFQFETREGVELSSEGARDEAITSFLYLLNFLLLKTVVHGIPV